MEGKAFLLEANECFQSKFNVAVAPTLVDVNKDVTNKLRIINLFDTAFLVPQDTVIGEAEPVEIEPYPLMKTENITEVNNYTTIRQIKLVEKETPVTWETNEGIIRSISKKGTDDGSKTVINIPEHLRNMYDEAIKGHSEDEKKVIAELLNIYSMVFSKKDTDLGRTNLVQHEIDTGDAVPVKKTTNKSAFGMY